MIASRHTNGIHVSADIAKSLAGLTNGYKVEMHDPVIRVPLFIDASNADTAHRVAIALCNREVVGLNKRAPRSSGSDCPNCRFIESAIGCIPASRNCEACNYENLDHSRQLSDAWTRVYRGAVPALVSA